MSCIARNTNYGRRNPLQKQNTPLDDFSARGAPCAPSHKVFVQRDYSEGTSVKFQTKFPPELEGKVRNI
jgi:hypothetical protein